MDDKIYKEVSFVEGGRTLIDKEHIIGYCTFPQHRGAVTKSIFKQHQCDKKKCIFFRKYSDRAFWVDYELKAKAKERHREHKKQGKKERKERPERLLRIAQDIAEELEYDIKVVRVRYTAIDGRYKLFYISPNPKNDYIDYWDLAVKFKWRVGGKVQLIHMKDQNGRYAVLEKEESMEENVAVKRMKEMEQRFDKARTAVDLLQNALQNYIQTMEDIKLLQEYYTGEDWKDDFSADEAGKLPKKLKRGVLSEDGVWFLSEDNKKLAETIMRLSDELKDEETATATVGV